ncbi:hypothetical protein Tco_0585425 [Tanacetum coccineum]
MKNTVLNVHPTTSTSTATITTTDLQHQLYLKMKSNLQAQVANPDMWDILKKKFEKIVEVVRVTTKQQKGLDYMEQIIVMKETNKPDSLSEADFKYLNKNDIEDMYYLCLNKKLGIESNQIKINLTAPTLIYPGIEACNPYSIIDKQTTGLIYLNNKEEKRVMNLVEIVKFCDDTLERVLKEVKLKIFETEFLKKARSSAG